MSRVWQWPDYTVLLSSLFREEWTICMFVAGRAVLLPPQVVISSQEWGWAHLLPFCCVSRETVDSHGDSRGVFMATMLVVTDRPSDTGWESVSPLSIQRCFWNVPNVLVFSVRSRERKENNLPSGSFCHLFPHPVCS